MRSLVRLDEVGNMFMRARLQHLQAVELHLDRVDRCRGAPALGTSQEGLDRDDVFALAMLRAHNRRKRALRNRSDSLKPNRMQRVVSGAAHARLGYR